MKNYININEAYENYKNGKTVIIDADRRCTNRVQAKKYVGQPVPVGVKFNSYVWNFVYWTNTKPLFYVAD